MSKLSTPCLGEEKNNSQSGIEDSFRGPCKHTLDFLCQFARIYHVEKELYPEYNGIIVN